VGIRKIKTGEKETQPKSQSSKDEKHTGKEKGGGQK